MQPTADEGITLPAPPDLDAIRLAFPHLEVIHLIGSGGMGSVFKARQPQLDRFVALKILPAALADQPGFSERFRREARALAKLSHPHIVTVHDYGQAGGFYYLLMEFVDGVNLRQLLQTKRLTPKEALSIVPPVCDALQCAHDHGIVHRDIKPENLLIDRSGGVKIADFGIAKMVGQDTGAAAQVEAGRSGAPATLPLGTPDYAAPEQANGAADHRADIYSLGVVLYEMLTGERPQGRIEAPSRRVQVDIRIDEIVLRALEREPELRFATAAEFRTRVEAVAMPSGPAVADEWKSPESGWGWLVGKMFGTTFRSRRAWRLANLSALGFLAFLGFLPLPGWELCFGFAGFFGLIGAAFIVESGRGAVTSSRPRRRLGMAAVLLGTALLLGSPFLNEMVDDFGLTKGAREHLRMRQRAIGAATEARKAATDAVMRLEAAKGTQNTADIERLAREAKERHDQSTRADFNVNQAAALKQADEQQRIAYFYLLAGGMVVAGLFLVFRGGRTGRPTAPIPPTNPGSRRVFIRVAILLLGSVAASVGLLVLRQYRRVAADQPWLASEERQRAIERKATVHPPGANHLPDRSAPGESPLAVIHAEAPAGTRDLVVRLHREGMGDDGPGIETSLHVVAGPASDPAKRMPRNGPWSKRTTLPAQIDPEGCTLVWTLPEEISAQALNDAAADIMGRFESVTEEGSARLPLVLPEGGPVRLAAIRHPDGWECHLFVTAVKRSPPGSSGAGEDAAIPEAAEPAAPPSKAFVQSYAVGFALQGAGEGASWLDDFRAAIGHAMGQAFPESAPGPEFTLNAETGLMIVKATLEEHMIIAQMVAARKENAKPPSGQDVTIVTRYPLDFAAHGGAATLQDAERRDLLEQVGELGGEADISLQADRRALIVKAPPGQQKRVAELVEAMRRRARPDPAAKRNP